MDSSLPELSGQVSAPVPLAVLMLDLSFLRSSNTPKAKDSSGQRSFSGAFHKSMNEGNTSMT